MPEQKERQTLLVIEDDQALSEMLKTYFTMQGYEVLTSAWGRQGVEQAQQRSPHLILLDIRLPDINGFEVCERLQASHVTRSIPVIFLTERSDRVDKLKGLALGVIDYITKPFDIQEVRLRVRNTLRRVQELTEENPITSLPEGAKVTEELALLTGGGAGKQVLAVTLHGLNTFRELYGFVASDDVLRVTAMTLRTAVHEVAGEEGFVGHISDNILAVIIPPPHLDTLFKRIDDRLARSLEFFYPADNRGANAQTDDRLKLEISMVDPTTGGYATPQDMIEALKSQVKAVYTA
jgi:CheY-like chemotaxis protein